MGKTNLEYSSLHKKYWDRKIFNRGIVQEIQNEQKHLQSVSIRANELHYFNKITNKNKIAQYTVLTAIYTFLIKRLIFDFDGYIVTNISEKNNSLLLSYPFDLKISFKEYLQKVKGEILETLTYSDFSSDAINEKYAVDNFRLLSHYAINVNSGAVIPCNGISFNVKINENEDIDIQVSYLDGFVNKPIVEFLVHNFTRFIANLESNLEFDLSEYPIISEIERRQLLVDFNKTTVEYPRDKTIIDLFEEQVEKIPNDIAVVFEDTELTYKELNEKSNQLASYLRDNYSLKADDLAGIKLERSERMIVAILGILKSGAAYVPIDVNYPEERIAYIEQDSNSKLIVDEELLEVFAKVQNSYSKDNLKLISTPNDLAYVIYTSGTTGNPKGVMIEHGNLVNSTMSRVELYQFQKVLLTSTIAFDPSVAVIWGGLLSGGTLVIANESIIKDSEKITEVIIKNSVTDILCVPSYYDFLYSELIKNRDSLRLKNFILGGEKIKLDFITTYNENLRNIGLYNEYGPTECTVWSTVCKLDDSLSCIPIGKPISNTKVYILDESLQPLPIGAIGKLYISGAGVARGYLNKPELTKEKFISNPFIEGLKMYDTGDLGKWLPDGNIEFMGRKDHQVKIRGFRIELGEIENVILQYSDNLKQVVVEAKEANGEKSLVAYFTSAKIIDKSELRNFLLGKLPDYMVPGFYVELDELPLTPNGKIDRKALPGVDGEDLIRNEYVAPRSKEEKLLVSVLEDVLKRDSISIKDNFYNLGGDSIKSIQIVSRLKQHGYTLKIQHILQVPVLEQLTKYLEVSVRTIDQSIVTGAVDFTPVQRYFFEDPIFKVHHHFNQSVVLKSKEALSHNFLAKSIAALMEQHDVLRMVYKKQEGNWMQFNQDLSSSDTPVAFYDLREEENGLEVMADLGAKLQSGFDLEAGPLLKVGHFRLKDGDRLALIIHHLVVDGVSWRILLEDLSTLYAQCAAGENLKLPLKTDSFQRWASLQKEYAYGDNQKSEKPYWENICSESVPAFPMDMEKQESSIKMDSSVSFSLDESITELLQTQVHGAYNTEINDVLLTGLGLAIKDTFGLDKSVVRMEGHGREDIIADVDISRTVGWFTSAYPFVLNLADSKSAITSLIEVKEDLRRIPNKGIGYGIQKYLSDGFNDV
ncbi:amino acid adenylation domain-containing protein, partial [Flavobacterium collinsii]|uniref:amino acid adenylation domain-containing protein n=1 Tax=Flavobacterium collinsii TaxID=1114861 RepID=UPI0037571AB8